MAEKVSASARDLRKERDRLNAVILSMRDGLMVLDADGRADVVPFAPRGPSVPDGVAVTGPFIAY